jgi:hypothetical protein
MQDLSLDEESFLIDEFAMGATPGDACARYERRFEVPIGVVGAMSYDLSDLSARQARPSWYPRLSQTRSKWLLNIEEALADLDRLI